MLEQFLVVIAGGLAVLFLSAMAYRVWKMVYPKMLAWKSDWWGKYAIWRTSIVLRRYFSTPSDRMAEPPSRPQINVHGPSYQSQIGRKSEGLTLFAFMDLGRGVLAPKVTDYRVGTALERLIQRGELARLPMPSIGGSYSTVGNRPAAAERFAIVYNENRVEARAREAEAELDRMCVEYHYWPIGSRCEKRYRFELSEEIDGEPQRIRTVLKDKISKCESCWEQPMLDGE